MLSRVVNIESGMNRWIAVLRVVGVGFYIGGSIILGAIAGHWLDGLLNTKPVLVIVGLVLGIVVAFYGVYIMVRPFIGNKQNKGNS